VCALPPPYPLAQAIGAGAPALRCHLAGATIALPSVLCGLLALRDGRRQGALLAAAAAGLLANAALLLDCASVEVGHLLAGHATIVVTYLAGVGLFLAARPERAA
jgi:hypothetical protein